jgi:Flp pilus assembly protein protease CpaA
MLLIAGWPMLIVLAVAALTVAAWVDSRSRFIVNWLLLPVLLEGVLMHWFYTSVP